MRVTKQKLGNMDMVVAQYDNLSDLAAASKRSKIAPAKARDMPADWAGGTPEQFHDKCVTGDPKYAKMAQKYVENFANLALKDYDRVLEYNLNSGQLDYQAAMGGDPMCMYGMTIEETDSAPVYIYIDTWTSATVKPRAMEMRGVAVLALALALTAYRPVRTMCTTALRHTPTSTDTLQIIEIPTAPMDLSSASFMLGSPMFFRLGMLPMVWELAKSTAWCGVPGVSNASWQDKKMGIDLAKLDGVNDVVFLPRMYGGSEWLSQDYCLDWIKKQLARFVCPN